MNITRRRPFRWSKRHLIKLTLTVFIFYYILSGSIQNQMTVLPYVVLHLDLKGASPKLSYFTNLITLLKKLGVNGLLIEYEDMFPYDGQISNLKSPHSYRPDELNSFLDQADQLGMEIIPYVQTFGHMEFALKYMKFAHLREDPIISDTICPSKEGSKDLIKNILEQIIKFHSKKRPLKYIHIGCGEVLSLNKCSTCRKMNMSRTAMFASHIREVYNIVQRLSPNTKILIWFDMLRYHNPSYIKDLNLPIQPVAWDFQADSIIVDRYELSDYSKQFKNIWIATAYKGAGVSKSIYPVLKNRFKNHYKWLKYLQEYTYQSNPSLSDFQGIILTGRSRHTYLSPHCELLPTAIPSIVINLLLIKLFKSQYNVDMKINWREFYFTYLHNNVKKNLNCDLEHIFINDDPLQCHYMGANIANEMKNFQTIDQNLTAIMAFVFNYSENIRSLHEKLNKIVFNLLRIKVSLRIQMQEWYSDDAAKIYVDEKCEEYNKIFKLIRNLIRLETQLRVFIN